MAFVNGSNNKLAHILVEYAHIEINRI